MKPDGTIDYTPYTRVELEDALRNIDATRFPLNQANLLHELSQRPPEVKTPQSTVKLERWVQALGWYQLTATIIFAHKLLQTDFSRVFATTAGMLFVPILALSALMAFGGLFIVRRRRLGVPLSIAAFLAQSIAVKVPGFSYQFLPLLGIQLFWSPAKLGVIGILGPETKLSIGMSTDIRVAVDVFAVLAIVVLAAYARHSKASAVTSFK